MLRSGRKHPYGRLKAHQVVLELEEDASRTSPAVSCDDYFDEAPGIALPRGCRAQPDSDLYKSCRWMNITTSAFRSMLPLFLDQLQVVDLNQVDAALQRLMTI